MAEIVWRAKRKVRKTSGRALSYSQLFRLGQSRSYSQPATLLLATIATPIRKNQF